MRTAPALILAATVVLTAAACTAQEPPAAPGASEASESVPMVTGEPPMDAHELPTAAASPTWDAASRAEALDVATTAFTAWARPDVDEETWWEDLSPLLSTRARTAYVGTDPALIPVREVTGAGEVVDDSTGYLAWVRFPTDAGAWDVLVARNDDRWTVERIVPAEDGAR